ncbi:MAG: macro domain-containing protein [bacterium]
MELRIRGTTVEVAKGDLTKQETDAIVNAANNQLLMGGGVAGAIKRKGGDSIQEECNKLAPIEVGEAAITGAGNLSTKYVIHAATMGMDFETDENRIRESTASALNIAEVKGLTSIAFPALGCGVGGFALDEAAKVMLEAVMKHLRKPSTLKIIRFVLIDDNTTNIFETALYEHYDYIKKNMYKNPVSTVDIIISFKGGVVLVKRLNPPYGWAIPGGFVEYGETLEHTAQREAKEETNLDLTKIEQFHTYSDPARDPRQHTISTVFTAKGEGTLKAGSDAGEAEVFDEDALPDNIAFDHRSILEDYFTEKY